MPGHSHHQSARSRLVGALILVGLFTGVEVVAGLLTGSLALLADAGHMLADVGALALSLFALWYARRPHDHRRTYGYHRTEVLAALTNGVGLMVIVGVVVVEALERLREPPDVLGGPMMVVAAIGLLVNLAALAILHRRGERNLNLRGAVLHVMGDALGSVAAVTAGLLVWWKGWLWADPALSLAISALIAWSALRLIRESAGILMEGVPPGMSLGEVQEAIAEVDGVREVHDLHVWTISSGIHAVSVHVRVDDPSDGPELVERIRARLAERFGLDHCTVQVERTRVSADVHRLPGRTERSFRRGAPPGVGR